MKPVLTKSCPDGRTAVSHNAGASGASSSYRCIPTSKTNLCFLSTAVTDNDAPTLDAEARVLAAE
ncbi:hypothetical protein ACP70R_017750 [Stipagrostis hirtigluma subsp. patula]